MVDVVGQSKAGTVTAVVEFIKIVAIVVAIVVAARAMQSAWYMLPEWIVGPSVQELNEKLIEKDRQIADLQKAVKDIQENERTRKAAQEAADLVLPERDAQIKDLRDKIEEVGKRKPKERIQYIEVSDASEEEKTKAVIEVTIDTTWTQYCLLEPSHPSCTISAETKKEAT